MLPLDLRRALRAAPNTARSARRVMTLRQACSPEYQGAQCAFKDLMTH